MTTKKTTIKENFEGLLETIKSAGINLSESQLASLGKFKQAMEAKVAEAERTTEARITKEYRQVFESLLDNLMEHEKMVARVRSLKEAKKVETRQKQKMADRLDDYLNSCLEEMITEKAAVDYTKMKKYETLVESMKGLVLENSDEVRKFKDDLEKKYKTENSNLIKENKDLTAKVGKLTSNSKALKEQVEISKAAALVEAKVKDLPAYEADKIRKHFAGKTVDEVQKTFKGTLKAIQEAMEKDELAKECNASLEERISSIIDENDDGSEETDKVTPTVATDDGPVADFEQDDEVQPVELSDEIKSLLEDDPEQTTPTNSDEELKKNIERNNRDEMPVDEDDDLDGVVLDESEKIDSRTMQFLIERCRSIAPRGRKNC